MPAKPVLIAQISDLHIKPPGSLAYGRVDTAKALERCVAALNAFRPRPDLVVIQVYITNAFRAYRIADHYRARGSFVALGGLHVTALPGEAARRSSRFAAFISPPPAQIGCADPGGERKGRAR